MRPPIESLDAFLEGPHQRELTRVLRKLLSKGRSIALVHGDGPTAARLIAELARTFPVSNVHLSLVEADPVRVTLGPDDEKPRVMEVPGATVDGLIRSLLRQDPDAIAVTSLEHADPKLLLNTAFTGHQLLVGSAASSLEAAVAALCVGSEGLDGHVRAAIDVACEVNASGRLRRIVRGDGKGAFLEAARVEGPSVVVEPSLVEVPAPATVAAEPKWAPPLDARPLPTLAPRPAFLPVTEPGASSRSLLGTRVAHRPVGAPWPLCRDCGRPLALIVQLDLFTLPVFTARGLVQLFLCTAGGCELTDETSKGVLAEVLEGEVAPVDAPEALTLEVLAPGAIVSWRRFEEDPQADDLARLGLVPSGAEAEGARPMRCDKLGGWPAWEQGLDWPSTQDGAPFELLFQFAEDALLAGGTPDRWDEASASQVPGARPRPVLDPNHPCHFPSVLTAEAVAFLFWHPASRRLAFRWQTG
jgi:cell division septation protein DedD